MSVLLLHLPVVTTLGGCLSVHGSLCLFTPHGPSLHCASGLWFPSVSATCGSLPFCPVSVFLSVGSDPHLFQMSQDEPLLLPFPLRTLLLALPEFLAPLSWSSLHIRSKLQSTASNLLSMPSDPLGSPQQRLRGVGEGFLQVTQGSRGKCGTD